MRYNRRDRWNVVAAPHDVTAPPIDLKTLPSVVAYDNVSTSMFASHKDGEKDAVYGDVRGILSNRYRAADAKDSKDNKDSKYAKDSKDNKGRDAKSAGETGKEGLGERKSPEADEERGRERQQAEHKAKVERVLRYQKQRHLASAWADGEDTAESLWWASVLL